MVNTHTHYFLLPSTLPITTTAIKQQYFCPRVVWCRCKCLWLLIIACTHSFIWIEILALILKNSVGLEPLRSTKLNIMNLSFINTLGWAYWLQPRPPHMNWLCGIIQPVACCCCLLSANSLQIRILHSAINHWDRLRCILLVEVQRIGHSVFSLRFQNKWKVTDNVWTVFR